MDFSEQFKDARKQLGLTQQQLADKTGIPFRTIQNWEGGKSTPQDWCQRLVLAELKRSWPVRCMDCEHFTQTEYTESGYYCGLHSGGYEYVEMDPEDFCSYAKRKKG